MGCSHFDNHIFLSKTEVTNLIAAHDVDERRSAQANWQGDIQISVEADNVCM